MTETLYKFTLAAAMLFLAGCRTLPEANFEPAGEHLRVVTYNVNMGGSAPRAVEFLKAAKADIVCLQETHRQWELYLRQNLDEQYPHMVFHNSLGGGGISILSKYSLDEPEVIKSEAGWFPAMYTRAKTPIGPVGILNVHLKPPLSEKGSVTPSVLLDTPGIHIEEMETFLGRVDKSVPLLIMGDFNEDESGGACKRLAALGYIDGLSMYDRKSPTWIWRTRFLITLKERYDHIFIDPAFECTGAGVFRVRASDHEPVMAAIRK